MRIVFVTSLRNPLGTAWIRGLQAVGHSVVALDHRSRPLPEAVLEDWAWPLDVPVVTISGSAGVTARDRIDRALGGAPDVLIGWWGSPVFRKLCDGAVAYPSVPRALIVDTYPSASMAVTEVREAGRYLSALRRLDGIIYSSQEMRYLMERRFSRCRSLPGLIMPETFPASAFLSRETRSPWKLHRSGNNPHVVFIGRSDLLDSRDRRLRKDAVGPLLRRLASTGVEVFVAGDGRRRSDGVATYPTQPASSLFDGRFAAMLSQFDAQLPIYYLANATIRRRVSTGLSTRFATGLTTDTPMLVQSEATFAAEFWRTEPFGAFWTHFSELVAQVHDAGMLSAHRAAAQRRHRSFAFERYRESLDQFLGLVAS